MTSTLASPVPAPTPLQLHRLMRPTSRSSSTSITESCIDEEELPTGFVFELAAAVKAVRGGTQHRDLERAWSGAEVEARVCSCLPVVGQACSRGQSVGESLGAADLLGRHLTGGNRWTRMRFERSGSDAIMVTSWASDTRRSHTNSAGTWHYLQLPVATLSLSTPVKFLV